MVAWGLNTKSLDSLLKWGPKTEVKPKGQLNKTYVKLRDEVIPEILSIKWSPSEALSPTEAQSPKHSEAKVQPKVQLMREAQF